MVTIKGSGFKPCSFFCNPPVPPQLFFGGIPALSARIVDEETITAVTPPRLPGTVDVHLEQDDGVARDRRAFTYTGEIEEAFERLLVPIFVGPVNGAHGSIFYTQLRAAANGGVPVLVWGLVPQCIVTCIFPDEYESPFRVTANPDDNGFEHTGRPGKFLYVPKSMLADLYMNLRVYDASRSTLNFGTEIPIVRSDEFTSAPIRLLGVPLDPVFRNSLRIYADEPTTAEVKFAHSNETHMVELRPGLNMFDPAHAAFSGFNMVGGMTDLTVTAPVPIWAFISVTNNETQLITTISPQR